MLFILLPKSYFASFLIGSACSMFASPGALGIGYLTDGGGGGEGEEKKKKPNPHNININNRKLHVSYVYIHIDKIFTI